MCMEHRFSTTAKITVRTLCVIALCGLSWSCKDEYLWDDEKPTWLNRSIYESLQEGLKDKDGNVIHQFKNYVMLLEDKDVNPEGVRNLKDVLSKTGSKTVFAADDNAWEAFYKHNATLPEANPWHNATSYANLSPAQKKLLIHSSMLNNAIVMENLASSDGSGSNPPIRGEYMRRFTDVDLVDTVTYLPANEVPFTYNTDDMEHGRDYWAEFRGSDGTDGPGIYLVMDSTLSMMLHFTQEHMAKKEITDDDFAKFMGRTRETRDVHIYDALLLEQDQVAENGYVNVTEKVIKPLPNMAEMIRTNGQTKIFSHMLDRFSFPYPNAAVTRDYRNLHPSFTGTIYTKKYFSLRGAGGRSQKVGPDGKTFQDEKGEINLQYDPGWNQFYNEDDQRVDMAAMFVPNDDALMEYFSEGGAGWQLIRTYAPDPFAEVPAGDYDALFRKIDFIPLSTLADLLNVIMFNSFNGSVPSKMHNLRDFQSQEEMFTPEDLAAVDTCLLACNGAVYVTNKVYGPASYISVMAPANISTTNLIMKWAIKNGSDNNADYMHMNYYAYLMAMRSQYAFFLPSDEALKRYYDPVSFTSTKPRVIQMSYRGSSAGLPVTTGRILYRYDLENGLIGSIYNLDQLTETELLNRLKDILESHTIVYDGTNPIDNEDEYYIAKNHAALKVTKDEHNEIIKVQGGFQLENERAGIVNGDLGTHEINVDHSNINHMANGTTFVIDDAPIIPASRSIYYIVHKEFADQCSAFYDLTDMESNADIIKACGLDPDKMVVWLNGASAGGVDYNVKFFNNMDYTVLVPTNEAIAEAAEKGLPTWEDIRADYESLPVDPDDDEVHILNGEDSLRIQAKITYLNNFIRCHFLDFSLFADKTERAEGEYVTQSYDTENGVFVKVHMAREKLSGETTLTVRDDQGGDKYTVEGDLKNIMARDITCLLDPQGNYSGKKTSPTGRSSMNNIVLQSSSFAVIHQINGVLNHTALVNGRYDSDWATPSAAKKYLKRFPNLSATDIKNMKHYE